MKWDGHRGGQPSIWGGHDHPRHPFIQPPLLKAPSFILILMERQLLETFSRDFLIINFYLTRLQHIRIGCTSWLYVAHRGLRGILGWMTRQDGLHVRIGHDLGHKAKRRRVDGVGNRR